VVEWQAVESQLRHRVVLFVAGPEGGFVLNGAGGN
jgi:hypothetical protein